MGTLEGKEYRFNPKTLGSGIITAIPQEKECPIRCKDCFFQSGRSYLEPLEDNLPNLPDLEITEGRVVRVNDGNDSNINRELVEGATEVYKDRFFNTSIPKDIGGFPGPVVLTINPANMTDESFHKLVEPFPNNLMFVRFRTNAWNREILDEAVKYYCNGGVPIVFTFMAYHEEGDIPEEYKDLYTYKKRTSNSYWVINERGWGLIVSKYSDNPLVYTCGKDWKTHLCTRCGNCIREYFNAKERMHDCSNKKEE